MSETMIRKELESIKSKIEKLLQTLGEEPASTTEEKPSNVKTSTNPRVNLWFKDVFVKNEKGIRDVILGKSYNANIWKYSPVNMEDYPGKDFKVEKDLKTIATSIFTNHYKTKDEKKYMKDLQSNWKNIKDERKQFKSSNNDSDSISEDIVPKSKNKKIIEAISDDEYSSGDGIDN